MTLKEFWAVVKALWSGEMPETHQQDTMQIPLETDFYDRTMHLYDVAYSFIGRDASPDDSAPDELACSESVSNIIQKAFPEGNFPTILSTKIMYNYFCNSTIFELSPIPTAGCVIISPTGTGVFEHGHVGIVGAHESPDGSLWVMSNSSQSGLFEVNYTISSWHRYYEKKGQMPVLFFRVR